MVGEGEPFLKFWNKIADFQPIFTCSTSAVTLSEKEYQFSQTSVMAHWSQLTAGWSAFVLLIVVAVLVLRGSCDVW